MSALSIPFLKGNVYGFPPASFIFYEATAMGNIRIVALVSDTDNLSDLFA